MNEKFGGNSTSAQYTKITNDELDSLKQLSISVSIIEEMPCFI